MLIVGERINASRRAVAAAITSRDSDFIRREATRQVEAGAGMLDVNAGLGDGREGEHLCWLTRVVQEAVGLPLSLDSSDPEALAGALKVYNGVPLINSISAEKKRLESVLPLIKEHGASVVALTMGEGGMPTNADERLKLARTLAEALTSEGIEMERVYFDPLVRPLSTEQHQALEVLGAVRRIKQEIPGAKVICGLSNISFGLPARALVNRTFLALMMHAGIDAVLIDPLQPGMRAVLRASSAILGEDEYSLSFIQAARQGKLE